MTDDGFVDVADTTASSAATFIQRPFDPQAIAIDPKHNHIFVSDFHNNAIAVYMLAGTPIATLHERHSARNVRDE